MSAFGQILDMALDENLKRQQVFASNKQAISATDWLLEYATVQLNFGRQTGKTTAIQRRATSRDLVVTWNSANARWLAAEAFFKPQIVTIRNLEEPAYAIRGHSYDRIWVDNAMTILSDTDLLNVYRTAVMTSAKQVILLG